MSDREHIKIIKDGPYLVYGTVPMNLETIGVDAEGQSWEWQRGHAFDVTESYALCRCGESQNKPFCDGSHTAAGFDGTETASREPFDKQAETMAGPGLTLADAQSLCAYARFCDRAGSIWKLIELTGDPGVHPVAVHEATHCPAGRLVVRDPENGHAIEPEFPPSIGLIEDPAAKCSGPIWVRGGIRVESSDGTSYEVRNRVTLCRCGASQNKPFCDGAHAEAGFTDGLSSVPAAPR